MECAYSALDVFYLGPHQSLDAELLSIKFIFIWCTYVDRATTMRRRQFLLTSSVAFGISTAGCQGSDDSDEEASGDDSGSGDDESDDASERTIPNSVLDSEPSSCPPQSLSEAEKMPARPDGFEVWSTDVDKEAADLREDGTTHYADQIDIWYTDTNDATYRLLIHLWENADIAEEDWVLSPEAIYYKDDQEFEMNTALKAQTEHITITIRTDSGGQEGIESIYESLACVDQSDIFSREPN